MRVVLNHCFTVLPLGGSHFFLFAFLEGQIFQTLHGGGPQLLGQTFSKFSGPPRPHLLQ